MYGLGSLTQQVALVGGGGKWITLWTLCGTPAVSHREKDLLAGPF